MRENIFGSKETQVHPFISAKIPCLRQHKQAVTLHLDDRALGFPFLLKPSERSSCRKHHLLQCCRRLLFEFFTFSEFANLVASFAIPTTAALLAVYPSSAGRAHATSFPFLFPRIDGRCQFILHWILCQASHMERALCQKHEIGRAHV